MKMQKRHDGACDSNVTVDAPTRRGPPRPEVASGLAAKVLSEHYNAMENEDGTYNYVGVERAWQR